jgi:hypothetical protein
MSTYRELFGGMLHWTVQNMNKGWDKQGGAKGPLWRHGRARLWVRLTKAQRAECKPAWSFGISWSFGGRSCRAMLTVGDWNDDTDIGLGLAIPGIALWFDAENIYPSRWRPKDGRDLGFFVGDGSIFVKLWCSLHDWYSDKPFSHPSSSKRQPVLHVIDWLLGKQKLTKRELSTHMAPYALPEGEYPVKIVLSECSWKRRRWPRARVIRRAEIEVLNQDQGIPIPGKGENGWDMDEDALYSLTTTAATVDEALVKLHASVMRDRERYGGSTWLPAQASAH